MSRDRRLLATAGDDKQLKIWDLEPLTLLSARELQKKPTSIEFSADRAIIISDKFGDVFRYTLYPDEPGKENPASGALAPHHDASEGELILGHASLLTACLLTPDGKYIITADRDEHIRVSWYPEGYVIESYCLGHTRYVSALHVPVVFPASLISGGGDFDLKVWDWMTGRLQQNVTAYNAVQPFIKVTVQNRRCGNDNEPVKSRGLGATMGKEKQRNNASPEPDGFEVQKPLQGSNTSSDIAFVVRRISSFVSGGENHVVFNVLGATAIFEFVLVQTPNQPEIHHYDFKRPVIDFTVGEEGSIWVLLDADFPVDPTDGDEHPRNLVQVIRWSTDKFVDIGNSPLLDSLNTKCLLPATTEDLQALNLYSDLTSLPKTADHEQGSRAPEDDPNGEGSPISVGLTKRALGRLKHKRALDQLYHDQRTERAGISNSEAKIRADCDDGELHSLQDGHVYMLSRKAGK